MNYSQHKKAVFFFCKDISRDPAALNVFEASCRIHKVDETDMIVDDSPVLRCKDSRGNEFFYVRTSDVVSHDYGRYLPVFHDYFNDCQFAGIVNWHEGANAPDPILSVHSTGDVTTGVYGPVDPIIMWNLLAALEDERKHASLDNFLVMSEATHWSGVFYDSSVELIAEWDVPVYDIEIGSRPSSWADPQAAEVVARALTSVFAKSVNNLRSLLCVGGPHFEPSYPTALLALRESHPIGISHILPNQWVVAGEYENPAGRDKLLSCINSIIGGIQGIVFHDNLKGCYKQQLRDIGQELGVPVFKHKVLRRPEALPI